MAASAQFKATLIRALNELESTGIARKRFQPPLHRILWRLGFEVPPPHYCTFIYNLVFCTFWFSVLWGSLMAIVFWSRNPMPMSAAVLAASMIGLPFGIGMALYYRHGATRHQLSHWSDLRPDHQDHEHEKQDGQ